MTGFLDTLNLDRALQSLALLHCSGNGFLTHDASAPVTFGFLVFVRVAFLDRRDELGELGFVFGADFCEGEDGCGLGEVSQVGSVEGGLGGQRTTYFFVHNYA